MKIFSLLLLTCCFVFKTPAQNLQFAENKGQWNSNVKFMATIGNASVFIGQNGYRVLLNSEADMKMLSTCFSGHGAEKFAGNDLILHSHAYEVNFDGASMGAAMQPENESPVYNNYFKGNDRSKWAAHCRMYDAVTFSNIYPGIDIRYYSKNDHLKYDFVIHAGADISKLKLSFNGVNGLFVQNDNLIIKTSLGNIEELEPLSYQQVSNKAVAVPVRYKIVGNTVSFDVSGYDRNSTLVIDPTLVFSSYVGSTADDWGYSSAYNASGNFYSGSIAFGNGFPVSLGAFQTTYHGGDGSEGFSLAFDIAIFKFNANGTQRLYATYLGGVGDEQPQSMIVDNNGNLIVTGRTSSPDFPQTTGNYGPCGGFDIYVTKLNADGSALLASRKFGGSGSDGVNISPKYVTEGIISVRRNYNDDARSDVMVYNNSIYIVNATRSSNFPVTSNAFGKTLGGMQDGVFMKLSSNLASVFSSSFLGGNADDAAFVISRDSITGNIYVGGSTLSTNLALNATDDPRGILHKSFQGGQCDGFISMISNSSKLVKTCYIGTAGNDMLYELKTDRSGYVYVMGTTTQSFPLINAAWSQPAGKQYITKLDADLTQIQYSTNFGKASGTIPDITPVAFTVDNCENVYVAGWGGKANQSYYPTQSTFGLSTTADAISRVTDAGDFYIFVLAKDAGTQLYGSFFGVNDPSAYGDHVDGSSSRFDDAGNLYLSACANCGKVGTFPTTAGVWETNNVAQAGALCNYAAVKIHFDFSKFAGVPGPISGRKSNLCGGVTNARYSIDSVPNATSYTWTVPGVCTIVSGQGTKQIKVNIPPGFNAGYITVKAVSGCNVSDADSLKLTAKPAKPSMIKGPKTVNANQSDLHYSINGIVGLSYAWTVPTGAAITSGQGTNAVVVQWGSRSGNITVHATNNCGNSPNNSLKITVHTAMSASGENDEVTGVETQTAVAFPNPANGECTISFNAEKKDRYSIKMLDAQGRILLVKPVEAMPGYNKVQLNLRPFAGGVYFILITDSNRNTQRLRIEKVM